MVGLFCVLVHRCVGLSALSPFGFKAGEVQSGVCSCEPMTKVGFTHLAPSPSTVTGTFSISDNRRAMNSAPPSSCTISLPSRPAKLVI